MEKSRARYLVGDQPGKGLCGRGPGGDREKSRTLSWILAPLYPLLSEGPGLCHCSKITYFKPSVYPGKTRSCGSAPGTQDKAGPVSFPACPTGSGTQVNTVLVDSSRER